MTLYRNSESGLQARYNLGMLSSLIKDRSWEIMRLFACFTFIFVLMLSVSASAAVTTIQAMSFGHFISRDNSSQYDIVVNTDGSYSYDGAGYVMVTPPQPGVYDIDGLGANGNIDAVLLTQNTPLTSLSARSFQIVNLTETHPATTDGLGVARFRIGGTARSSGNGTNYIDETFNGVVRIDITVSF